MEPLLTCANIGGILIRDVGQRGALSPRVIGRLVPVEYLCDLGAADTEVAGKCGATFESARIQESLVVMSQLHAVGTLFRSRRSQLAFVEPLVPRMEHNPPRSL